MKSAVRKFVLLLCLLGLGGCYVVNQQKFERRVYREVAVGMSVDDALARLTDIGLTCTATNPAECSRVRQSLMPYSCVERVRVHWTDPARRVTNIEIPAIACAGL